MFDKYLKEFVDICGFIKKKNQEQMVTESRLYVLPTQLRKMLDKQPYQEANIKLHIWRNLGWLICDPDKPRFTKNRYINGKTQRMAVLNRVAFEQIIELIPNKTGENPHANVSKRGGNGSSEKYSDGLPL